MSLAAAERETIVRMSDASDVAEVYTAQRRRITQLKKNPAARLIKEGATGTSRWARFEIEPSLISFRTTRRPPTAGSGQGFGPKR